MRKRTQSREAALKILYARDISLETIEEVFKKYWIFLDDKDSDVKNFTKFIVVGVDKSIQEIDNLISMYAANWKLGRMAVIDKNILRIAVFELLFSGDMPPKVAINEAIEMAKKYGDLHSGKFVNGILDKINKERDVDAQKK